MFNGYSKLSEPEVTEKDMEIQNRIEEKLSELIEDLEDTYGITIDCGYSWDYYEKPE